MAVKPEDLFRAIPSVDICLRALREADSAFNEAPPTLLRDLVVSFWDQKRKEIRTGLQVSSLSLDSQLETLAAYVRRGLRPALRRVLNGTGVIIHTNLGRSILSQEAAQAAMLAAGSYTNLEMDLATGERGSRHAITEELIKRISGAEAALVVNNNAAAVLLILDSLCKNGEAIVSRGELVEIGGSFRIPDIMAKSGAVLREVGSTNRTHLKDYRAAINENTRAILSVHTSNFRIIGFHKAVELPELKRLAEEHDLPLIFDLGSGNILDFTADGLPPEPTVAQIIASGADCVCFSGDKALGGPQAGIIAGKKRYIELFKQNPLARALRCDKLCLAALEATLRAYLEPEKARELVPTPRMIGMTKPELARAAHSLGARIKNRLKDKGLACKVTYREDISRVGGGAYPECNLPTTLLCLVPESCSGQELRARLLETDPPLIGRMENDAFCLDPRTLLKSDYEDVVGALVQALEGARNATGKTE